MGGGGGGTHGTAGREAGGQSQAPMRLQTLPRLIKGCPSCNSAPAGAATAWTGSLEAEEGLAAQVRLSIARAASAPCKVA